MSERLRDGHVSVVLRGAGSCRAFGATQSRASGERVGTRFIHPHHPHHPHLEPLWLCGNLPSPETFSARSHPEKVRGSLLGSGLIQGLVRFFLRNMNFRLDNVSVCRKETPLLFVFVLVLKVRPRVRLPQ